MFGIFQADLPIGRHIWLAALTLICTRLVSDVPLKLATDPAELGLSVLVYTGHSFFIGVLLFIVASVPFFVIATLSLHKRAANWTKPEVLLQKYRHNDWLNWTFSAAIVCAADASAHEFGERSLQFTGLLGITVLLLRAIFDSDDEPSHPLLEVRSSGARTTARLFLSGELILETRLDEDIARALARLRSAGWVFEWDGILSRRSIWLRRQVSPAWLRLASAVVTKQLTRQDVMADIKRTLAGAASALFLLGWLIYFIGFSGLLYAKHTYNPDSLPSILRSWAQGFGAAIVATAGIVISLIATTARRWLDGRSILTGREKAPPPLHTQPPPETQSVY